MKRLLAPLLALTLIFEGAAVDGGVFCRMLGRRQAACCCPDGTEPSTAPVLAVVSCCDVVQGSAPANSARLTRSPVAGAPDRISPAIDVEPPALRADRRSAGLARRHAIVAGPPRRVPVYLSLGELLI